MYYIRTADRLQRTARWMEDLDGGIDHVREVVVDDSLGLAAELEAAMAAHVDNYEDEWAATLATRSDCAASAPSSTRRARMTAASRSTASPGSRNAARRGPPPPQNWPTPTRC